MSHTRLQEIKSIERVVKLNAEQDKNRQAKKYDSKTEVADIYCQYTVDTGLVETVEAIAYEQETFNSQQAYGAQALNRAFLKLMIGLH